MSITIHIYKQNENENENILLETIEQNLSIKMIEFKNNLLKKYFPENNFLEIYNNTERIYKDYGLLFFDKGLLPDTNDNYLLSKFSIPIRTFTFTIKGINVEKKKQTPVIEKKNLNLHKKYRSYGNEGNEGYETKKEEGYVYNEEDFPALS